MKTLFFLFVLICFNHLLTAQQDYTVNNETLSLNTEVEGTLDLLWNTFNGEYRYFINESNGKVTELKNTKGINNKYQNDYKEQLKALTGMDASKVKLTLFSLKNFINDYNASKDSGYTFSNEKAALKSRLGVYGGVTNNRFVDNPSNIKTGLFGAEFEILGKTKMTKHAGFASVVHTLSSNDFNYSSTQIALGYRFRFIDKPSFNVYGQTKFVTYTFSKSEFTVPSLTEPGTFTTVESSGSAFDAPLIFGLGADFKIGNGYITFVYDALFAVLIDNKDNFPINFALGYKFNL